MGFRRLGADVSVCKAARFFRNSLSALDTSMIVGYSPRLLEARFGRLLRQVQKNNLESMFEN